MEFTAPVSTVRVASIPWTNPSIYALRYTGNCLWATFWVSPLDCNSTWWTLLLLLAPMGSSLLQPSSTNPASPLGSATGDWLGLLALVMLISVSIGNSGSCSIISFWVVPWPLGTTPISLMVAVELGWCVSCLDQLNLLLQ